MFTRAFLFAAIGAASGAFLGAVSVGALVQNADGLSQRAALLWAVLGAVHGLVLFFSSIGESPVIEDTRTGRFVASGLADSFDYRRFGHRIPYIAGAFALVVAFVLAPLLVGEGSVELRSAGVRFFAAFGLSFVWTGGSMLLDTVIVSKIALS